MTKKTFAIGAIAILTAITTTAVVAATSTVLQSINPVAALGALTVAIIGFVWFKRTQ